MMHGVISLEAVILIVLSVLEGVRIALVGNWVAFSLLFDYRHGNILSIKCDSLMHANRVLRVVIKEAILALAVASDTIAISRSHHPLLLLPIISHRLIMWMLAKHHQTLSITKVCRISHNFAFLLLLSLCLILLNC